MSTELLPQDRAKKVIGCHTTGVICSGEVWNQFVEFVTPDTMAEWVTRFTPELSRYFRRLASEANFELYSTEQQRSALRLLIDWYDNHAT